MLFRSSSPAIENRYIDENAVEKDDDGQYDCTAASGTFVQSRQVVAFSSYPTRFGAYCGSDLQ